MIRVVIDTNVIVSGVLVDEGLPASILDLAANKKITMVVSADTCPRPCCTGDFNYPQDKHAGSGAPYSCNFPRRIR